MAINKRHFCTLTNDLPTLKLCNVQYEPTIVKKLSKMSNFSQCISDASSMVGVIDAKTSRKRCLNLMDQLFLVKVHLIFEVGTKLPCKKLK